MNINKKKLEQAMSTLIYGWGGDTPAEAVWTFNQLMEVLGLKTRIEDEEEISEDYDVFVEELRTHEF